MKRVERWRGRFLEQALKGSAICSAAVMRWLRYLPVAGHPPDPVWSAKIGRGYGLESGLSHKAEFDGHHYDAVSGLVDPATVLMAIRRVFGERFDHANFDNCWGLSGDEFTARRFVSLHNHVHKEQKRTVDSVQVAEIPQVKPRQRETKRRQRNDKP